MNIGGSILPPLGIQSSPSPLPSAEPESLWDDQIESEENFLKVRVDDHMVGKHGEIKPKRNDQDEQGEIPLDIHEMEKIEGMIEPE